MNIIFFKNTDNSFDQRSIYAGVYLLRIGNIVTGKSFTLYVGESYCMSERCSQHLYETFHNDPGYLGLTKEHLENPDLYLSCEVYEAVPERWGSIKERDEILKEREAAAIDSLHPISQYETSDRVLPDRNKVVSEKIKGLS